MAEPLKCIDASAPGRSTTVIIPKAESTGIPAADKMACDQYLMLHHAQNAGVAARYVVAADEIISLLLYMALPGLWKVIPIVTAVIGGICGVVTFTSELAAMHP